MTLELFSPPEAGEPASPDAGQPSVEPELVPTPTGMAAARWRRARGEEAGAPHAWIEGSIARAREQDRSPEAVTIAWELARLGPAAHQRGLHLLALLALADVEAGSTRSVLATETIGARLRALAPQGPTGEAAVGEALELAREPSLGAPVLGPGGLLELEGGHLQLARMAWLERRLAARLAPRARREVRDATKVDAAFSAATTEPPLTTEQARAVRMAAARGMSVITGGPGTGKTSIVLALLEGLARLGVAAEDVALAAPTGKATHRLASTLLNRLGEAATPRIETLHRLLGARPGQGRFVHDADNPLPARVLICDEASMLDLELATRLVSALEPDAQLILLGDAEQLPSVDAGAVLAQLVETLPEGAVVRLTESFRMRADDPEGGAVLRAAQALGRGDAQAFFREARGGAVSFQATHDPSALERFLDAWHAGSLLGDPKQRGSLRRTRRWVDGAWVEGAAAEVDALLARTAERQLLTVTRQAAFHASSESVSRRLHARYARAEGWLESEPFLPGEPVMMLRNDYERRLFNGDVGMVLSVAVDREPARLMAVFPTRDGPRAHPLGPLARDLVLAHAITVHKSQGSEYREVALLLPERDVPLLTREILYTALTRARSKVTAVGTRGLLELGARRQVARASGLGDALRAAGP